MKIESYLPIFPGFYNTIFEADEQPYLEDGKTQEDYNWDYRSYNNDIALNCVEWVESQLSWAGVKVTFQDIERPAFYNYSNDSINVEYEVVSIKPILAYLKEHEAEFLKYLEDTYTSCSGFTPSHSVLEFLICNELENPIEHMYYSCEDVYLYGKLK